MKLEKLSNSLSYKIQFNCFLITLLITANSYSMNVTNNERKIIANLSRNSLLSALMESSGTRPLSCEIAKKIIINEKNIVTNSDSVTLDSSLNLIRLAKEIDNKCNAMTSFKKNILPIIKKDGVISASIDRNYTINPTPQILKIKLINLHKKDSASELNQCVINSSIIVDDTIKVSMRNHSLDCQIDNYIISMPIDNALIDTSFILCVKKISWLPEFLQSCKSFKILKSNNVFNFKIITLRDPEFSTK
jgi:hypothetical protein